MDKNKKILLGVGVAVLLGYILFNKSKKASTESKSMSSFVNVDGIKDDACAFKLNGEIFEGKRSELDKRYCFSIEGKRGLAI